MPEKVCTYPCTLHYLCELHGLVPPSSSLCVIKAMTTSPGPVTGNWNRFCLCREESWRPWHHAGGKEGSRYTKHLLKERSWRFAIVCSLLKENYTRLHQFCTRLHFTHQGTLCTWFKQPNRHGGPEMWIQGLVPKVASNWHGHFKWKEESAWGAISYRNGPQTHTGFSVSWVSFIFTSKTQRIWLCLQHTFSLLAFLQI